ncbi:MAG: sigma-70 family RNA polymerase sigma factor [Pseudomonadota bacterium]
MDTQESIQSLLDNHGDMVWRIVLAHEHNPAVAEELYQEICFALWQAGDKIRSADNPGAYIARIATNQAVSHIRREVAQPMTVPSPLDAAMSDATSLEESLSRYEQQRRLLEAVRQLPLNWRLPITLTLEGFKPQEIAYVMGISANTVSLRLTRARRTLSQLLSNDAARRPQNTRSQADESC